MKVRDQVPLLLCLITTLLGLQVRNLLFLPYANLRQSYRTPVKTPNAPEKPTSNLPGDRAGSRRRDSGWQECLCSKPVPTGPSAHVCHLRRVMLTILGGTQWVPYLSRGWATTLSLGAVNISVWRETGNSRKLLAILPLPTPPWLS